jgi:transposase
MTHTIANQTINTLAIDLAKNSFQLHGANAQGKKALSKTLTRKKLQAFIANLPACTVVMEACGGANYFARSFTKMGHQVKLIAPQFVKPFVKSNKNDAADAEAICEAAQRPSMRFVTPKDLSQQDIQSVHRARSLCVAQRTALGNQIRGLLAEYGVVIPKGLTLLRKQIPQVLEDADNELTPLFRELLHNLYRTLCYFDDEVDAYNNKIQQLAKQDERCQRLQTIPGIGPIVATALVATIGDGSSFASGREAAAYLGLVPRQSSTGGKPTLLGISKRGDVYLRQLLIHGGRAVVRNTDKHDDYRNRWIQSLVARRNFNIASVAVANKNVRIAWHLLQNKCTYTISA